VTRRTKSSMLPQPGYQVTTTPHKVTTQSPGHHQNKSTAANQVQLLQRSIIIRVLHKSRQPSTAVTVACWTLGFCLLPQHHCSLLHSKWSSVQVLKPLHSQMRQPHRQQQVTWVSSKHSSGWNGIAACNTRVGIAQMTAAALHLKHMHALVVQ
jgi:hypothetical protein